MPEESSSPLELFFSADDCNSFARALVAKHGDHLMALARRRLRSDMAQRVDPEDIVQSAFRTFFRHFQQNEFSINDPDQLCHLLVQITLRKTLKQIAYERAAKRNPNRELGSIQQEIIDLAGREPDPEVATEFAEQFESLLRRLGDEEQQILKMRLDGYTNEEIERKLGIYDRKIRRVMERIRGLAQQEGFSTE